MFRLVRYRHLFRPALLCPKYFRQLPASSATTSSQVLCTYSNTQPFDGKEEQDSGTCEEPLSLPAEEGYGYYPSAVVGHRLGRYEIVRKVCVSISAGWHGD
jgi:hypothetical protein